MNSGASGALPTYAASRFRRSRFLWIADCSRIDCGTVEATASSVNDSHDT